MEKISIIIPVYNSEEYLSKCLESVINQTLDEIEIICINDASTDNSLDILKYYSKISNKIKIIDCDVNKGQGNRRNIGINLSKGKYILFLDSDDWLDLDACEYLYNKAEKNNVDLLLFNQVEHHKNDVLKERVYFKHGEIEHPDNFIFNYKFNNNMLVVGSYQTASAKLHRADFLRKNKIEFPTTRANEDVVFHVETVIKAEKIAYSPKICYHYRRMGQNSTQNNTILTKKGFNLLPIFYKIENLLKKENIFDELKINFFIYKLNESKIRLSSLENPLNKKFFMLLKKDFLRWNLSEDEWKNISGELRNFYEKIKLTENFDSFNNCVNSDYNNIDLKNQIVNDALEGNYLNLLATEKIKEDSLFNSNFNNNSQILKCIYNISPCDAEGMIFDSDSYKKFYPKIEQSHINSLVYHVLFGKDENKFRINNNIKNINTINKRSIKRKIRKFNSFGLNRRHRSTKIIVSLTSFPERIYETEFTIFSLLNQNLKPDEVILWLATDEFKNKEQDLPTSLLALLKNGLSVRWYNKNIKSYKKLIPTLKIYPNDIIVTADDDIYYPKDWLFNLFETHKEFPMDVICARSRKISINSQNIIESYNKWMISDKEEISSFLNFFTGAGGVLYPPNSLDNRVLDEELAMDMCPSTDDIWFWAMTVLNKRKIKPIKDNLNKLTFVNSFRELNLDNQTTLWKLNVTNKGNDVQFKKIFKKFPELESILIKNN